MSKKYRRDITGYLQGLYLALGDRGKENVYATMLEAGLAYTAGNPDWQGVFRRAKTACTGKQKKLYAELESAPHQAVDRMVQAMSEVTWFTPKKSASL